MDRFSTRLKRKVGESLSGYLMRDTKANHVEKFGLILSYIRKSGGFKEGCNNYSMDTLSGKHVNVDAISKITGLSYDEILPMTTIPMYRKFLRKDELLNGTPERFLFNQVMDIAHRRFCPDCLRQSGSYKLIWQIKDIELCNIHHTPLTTECPKCGAVQPYITNQLGALKCYKCNAILFEESKQPQNIELEHIGYQQYLYQQWEYLLDTKNEGLNPTPKMSYEKQMACTLLFLMLDKSSESDMKFRYLSIDQRKEIYRFIKDKHKGRYIGVIITPKKLIRHMYQARMSVEQFFGTDIPEDFIDDLTRYLQTDEGVLENNETSRAQRMRPRIREEKVAEILKTFEDYLSHREPLEKVTARDIHQILPYARSSYPIEVNSYLRVRIDEYNQRCMDTLESKIRTIAIVMLEKGEVPTYQKVADKIGFHVMNIKRNPVLINAIKDIRCK